MSKARVVGMILIAGLVATGCKTGQLQSGFTELGTFASLAKNLGAIDDRDYNVIVAALDAAEIIQKDEDVLTRAKMIADILSRPDVGTYVNNLIKAQGIDLSKFAPLAPIVTRHKADDVLRLYMQWDLASRKDLNQARKMVGLIAASDLYNGPLAWMDTAPRAGYQVRNYIAPPNTATGLTQQGKDGLAVLAETEQYGVGINSDWSVENGKGEFLPSLGRNASSGSYYDSVYAAGTRSRIDAIMAAAGSRPPTLGLLCLEATHPQAVPFYLEIGTWARAKYPNVKWAVNFLGAAQVQARNTPGFGADGILFANSHDPLSDIANEDGVMVDLNTYNVNMMRHKQSGKPYIGWFNAQGEQPNEDVW